ncbi:riboflavin kinase [Claviceps aff. purpurea]|uniref:Riboflavin kinase n=1 Tax=Claviceps aff. purpurea TaxID=1967640 RepID=A0A9P7QRN1_9HYPO|nr:riboflavin kinase [Claviceps aff. purpurea]
MEGKVIAGFGRGSKELGIPTANLPVDSTQTPWIDAISSGVYFGYASLQTIPSSHAERTSSSSSSSSYSSSGPSAPAPVSGIGPEPALFPMVMSIGYNPFYKNTVRSAEVHILHKFEADFYGAHMRLLIVGFIREEKDYVSREALIEDIEEDCRVARRSLGRGAWGAGEVRVREGSDESRKGCGRGEGEKKEEEEEEEEKDGGGETGEEWLLRKL